MLSKKLIKSSAIYVVLGFLPLAVNFLLSPLYSHLLTPEQNALIGQAAIFQSFISIFLGLSIDGAYSRLYFDYYKDRKKLDHYTSSVLLFVIMINVLFFIFFVFLGDRLFSAAQKNTVFTFSRYGIWAFIASFCTIIQSIILAYYRNEEKVIMFSVVSLLFFFSSVILILTGLLVFKAGAYGSIVGRSAGYLFSALIFLFVFFKRTGFVFKAKYISVSLKYSLPIVPYLFLMAMYGNIDRILIEKYYLLSDLGIYNFAFLMSGAVSVFISSGQNVIAPVIYRLLGEEKVDEKRVNTLFRWFHYANTLIISVGLALAILFTVIFIAPAYHSIIDYVGILFLAFIFRTYYLIYVDALFYFKKTRWIFLITLSSFLVGLASNYFLMPLLGITGICIAVMIINLTQAAGAYLQIRLYRLNTNYYKLTNNHLYTLLVIGSYFVSLFLLRTAGVSTVSANFAPALVSIIFSVFFIYKNNAVIGELLKTKLKRPLLFKNPKMLDEEIKDL